jgi:hypothetical protein
VLTSAEAHDTRTEHNKDLATLSRKGKEITVDLSSSELIKTKGQSLFQLMLTTRPDGVELIQNNSCFEKKSLKILCDLQPTG